ncbi:DUF2339 domain-containing protein [Nitrogeniibacter aestuarii]|uniref:DUF2339 domain-containing protein n=1 Tax=Nitrogeniibacter aestuarii TaxID=2815343 RepID=UPI001D10AA9C|nr:DUF2339 domain-containing protein [Nitrogeniibacter aestuarii]
MWIVIGLVLGVWLGSWGGLEEVIGGSVLGALGGLVVQVVLSRPARARLDQLEARIAQLESQVLQLRTGATPAVEDEPTPARDATAHELPSVPWAVEPPVVPAPAASTPAAPDPVASAETPAPSRRRGIDVLGGAATEPERAPSSLDQLYDTARRWLLGGNTVVRVGLLVLFFGLAFLARYAVENSLFPIELRLASIALGAVGLLGVGWRLRHRRAGYALSLQGGGVAALYLTIFAAMRLYGLIPPTAGFGLLLVIVVLSAALALLQRSQALAVIGTAGGFMAPILASTGQGSHVMLFSYYLLLSAGVLGIAWKQAWRGLNLTGFLFTFSIALLWGARDYRPGLFDSTEPFLIAFFLMYVAAAVLYAWRSAPQLKHYVDGTVVFGTPVVGFGLQAALTEGMPHALAISALVVGGFYVMLARWLHARARPSLGLLVESFLALGVAFLTLAIPLAVDGEWTGAAWALEGAALLWVGARQRRKLAMASGVLLQLTAGVIFFGESLFHPDAATPVLNSTCLGAALVALAGLASAHMADRWRDAWPRFLRLSQPLLLAWGVLWWVGAGFNEITDALPFESEPVALLLFLSASGALATLMADRRGWSVLRWPALLPVMGMAFALLGDADAHQAPWSGLGLLAWPLAIGAMGWSLRKAEGAPHVAFVLPMAHLVTLWLVCLSLVLSAAQLGEVGNLWRVAAMVLVPLAAWWLMRLPQVEARWPMRAWAPIYQQLGVGVMLVVALFGAVATSLGTGGSVAPLPYMPVLNPFDLTVAMLLMAAAQWWRQWRDALPIDPRVAQGVLAGFAFVLITWGVIRAIHHLAQVPWDADRLFASDTVQASVSLLWGALGLVLTFIASRRAHRWMWMAGAALLGVVVLKLFLVDMASTGTVARIVSFIGAGVVLLVVGYFSPLPPARELRS